ncbi:hypothetical protein FAVG1_06680 [Fusarium avenaceum]|nr:hypothetical protein FAVG1_06680 [Fusarium avenaceum]
MDDWGRSKMRDGGAECITDMGPGPRDGEEGAAWFRFDRFNVDVAVIRTPCFEGKKIGPSTCSCNEIWDFESWTRQKDWGSGKLQLALTKTHTHACRAVSLKRMDAEL